MIDNPNTEDTGYIDSAPSNIVTGEKECLEIIRYFGKSDH